MYLIYYRYMYIELQISVIQLQIYVKDLMISMVICRHLQ